MNGIFFLYVWVMDKESKITKEKKKDRFCHAHKQCRISRSVQLCRCLDNKLISNTNSESKQLYSNKLYTSSNTMLSHMMENIHASPTALVGKMWRRHVVVCLYVDDLSWLAPFMRDVSLVYKNTETNTIHTIFFLQGGASLKKPCLCH